MEYSKVTIEFAETSGDNFNVFAKTSGTNGENKLGEDLAYALGDVPRPLLVLARAIKDLCERGESPAGHPLFEAAVRYIASWQNYDVCIAQGFKPENLFWPDSGKRGG